MSPPKTLAICHYHIRPGGVTRVMSHAAEAMHQLGCRVVFLVGRAPEPNQTFAAEVRVIDGLDYEAAKPSDAADLADRMEDAAADALGGAPDIWHAHNHSLGKNSGYPAALRLLADRGHRLLLQMHDFAEDGRPANFDRLYGDLDSDADVLGRTCYPIADHVHYAVLNRRDHAHLLTAGLPPQHCHLLPNAVDLQMDEEPVDVDPGLFLYPTRAIRRKNIGEFLFWSAMAEDDQRFATTLAPNNPLEKPRYERWVQFAAEQKLPAQFEAGTFADTSFTALLASARSLVTTSVAEGFGLAFLEPALVGRPLVGRNLPAITEDFVDNGVLLNQLYQRLEVPVAWIDAPRLRSQIAESLTVAYRAYGQVATDEQIQRAHDAAVVDDRVEFGHLDEATQEAVIQHVHDSHSARSEVTPNSLTPEGFDDHEPIEANRQIVRQRYSLGDYGGRLCDAYKAVGQPTAISDDSHIGTQLLDAFLAPEHFLLLRT